MTTASELSTDLILCEQQSVRELYYQKAEREYGKNFADHLRDVVEAHHLIVSNERSSAMERACQQKLDGTK